MEYRLFSDFPVLSLKRKEPKMLYNKTTTAKKQKRGIHTKMNELILVCIPLFKLRHRRCLS